MIRLSSQVGELEQVVRAFHSDASRAAQQRHGDALDAAQLRHETVNHAGQLRHEDEAAALGYPELA